MRNLVLRGLLALICVFGPLIARAADFKMEGTDDSCDKLRGEVICMTVSISGKIGPGDASKLQQEVTRIEAAMQKTTLKSRVSLLYLDSPGGGIANAIKLRVGQSHL